MLDEIIANSTLQISELEENIQNEIQRKKKCKIKQCLSDLWDNSKQLCIHILLLH